MYVMDNYSLTVHPIYNMYGRTPYEILTGYNQYISQFIEYY